MGFLQIFSKQDNSNPKHDQKIGGYIRYYDLVDWWKEAFTDEERQNMEEAYQVFVPSGEVDNITLTKGRVLGMSLSTAGFLNTLVMANHREMARKVLHKAEEVNQTRGTVADILDEHFTLSQSIKIYYRDRKEADYYKKAIVYCKRQIELAPRAKVAFLKKYPKQSLPSHVGYKQLSIILDKEKKWPDAIDLCKKAQQEGWSGDWDKRVARYKKKSDQ